MRIATVLAEGTRRTGVVSGDAGDERVHLLDGPATVLDFLNRRLCLRPIPGKFCALAYVVLDPVRRRLAWANDSA